jgi:hypothetical protein
MRFVRLLAVVIIVYGLSYVQYGSRQFLAALEQTPTEGVWYSIATNFNIGIVVVVIGIGLLLMKEWARTLWLMSSIALFAVHIALFFLGYATGYLPTLQVLNVLMIVFLLLLSWAKLNRPEIKELFH